MTEAPAQNAAQIDYWNAAAGETWARFQDRLDRQLAPLGLAAIDALAPAAGERVVDIGCGCGHSTMQLAARVGPAGAVVGVDISRPMLGIAESRPAPAGAARALFLERDAQTDDLGAGAFDAAYSRFGVMFFSDPAAAFANIRKALKPGGRLAFVCWRPLQDNPWMRAPLDAAQHLLPPPQPFDPAAPGPFAFADPDRVRTILADAGFAGATVEPFDARIGGSGLEETVQLSMKVGPLGAAVRENPRLAGPIAEAVRAALESYVTPRGVSAPSAVWIARARNP